MSSDVKQQPQQQQQQTWTFTYSESVENHVGMETIGQKLSSGLMCTQLEAAMASKQFEAANVELIDLQQALPESLRTNDNQAWILIIRNAVSKLVDNEQFRKDVASSVASVDKKAWMRGTVKNKTARWNC